MTPAGRHDALLGALGVVVLLAAWEAVARSGLVSPAVFPAPSDAVIGTLSRLPPGEIAGHVAISLARIIEGFAIGPRAE